MSQHESVDVSRLTQHSRGTSWWRLCGEDGPVAQEIEATAADLSSSEEGRRAGRRPSLPSVRGHGVETGARRQGGRFGGADRVDPRPWVGPEEGRLAGEVERGW